jgi:hypothetical protein
MERPRFFTQPLPSRSTSGLASILDDRWCTSIRTEDEEAIAEEMMEEEE